MQCGCQNIFLLNINHLKTLGLAQSKFWLFKQIHPYTNVYTNKLDSKGEYFGHPR